MDSASSPPSVPAPGEKPARKRPGPKPGMKGKAPSAESQTGKLFLDCFFLKPECYPFRLPNMPRGKAINLSVGLNRCNKEFFKLADPSVPRWTAGLSAKAKAVSGQAETSAARAACRNGEPVPEGGDWYVEISESYLRTGNPSPAKRANADWLKGIVAQVEAETAGVRAELAREQMEREARVQQAKLEKERLLYEDYLGERAKDGLGGRGVIGSNPAQVITDEARKVTSDDLIANMYGLDASAPAREISPEEGLALLAAERAKERGERS